MTTKLSVTLVTLSMIATALIGVAAALPPYIPPGGDGHIGPNVNNDCSLGQEYGFGGSPSGSGTGYHRYINDNVGLLLDACFNAAGIAPFAGCASSTAVSDVSTGAATIAGSGGDVDTIENGVGQATAGASSAYQTPCGGLGGTGTDGEFEYGSTAAALNVRRGAHDPTGGDGIDGCLGDIATAHHASDTTIYVTDVVLGGAVGFSVSADWARPPGNTADGESHCGDGAIEPCETTPEDGIEEHVTDGDTGAVLGDVGDITSNLPTSSSNLNHDLDVLNGCNPLDMIERAAPAPLGSSVNSLNPTGATLADFGNGGATGWLTVIINTGPGAGVCYDVPTGATCGGDKDAVSVTANPSAPTLGWVWTGSGTPDETPACTTSGDAGAGTGGSTGTVHAGHGEVGPAACVGAAWDTDPYAGPGNCTFSPGPDGKTYTCTFAGVDFGCSFPHVGVTTYRSNDPNPHPPGPGDMVISRTCL